MFAQIYKGFGLHRFWNCLAAFDGAAVRVLSVLVAVLLMSVSFIPGDATARSDDEVYPVDATLLRAPAHRFSTPPVNVKRPVRLAIVKYVRPSPNEEIVPASVTALKQYFGEDRVQVAHLSLTELSEAIKRGDVDVFLSSAGFYRRLADEGVKSLVSAVSLSYPDPNHGEGTAIVAAADRSDIESLRDLKGGVLATSTPTAFTGLLVPYGEMMKQGIKVDGFFRETLYLGDDDAMETAPRHLLDGTADVAFLRLCFLEEWLERHPEHQGRFKVINRKDGPGEVCARSTELYPTWTVGTTKVTDPRVSRSVTQALLALKPTGTNGIYWGVATDYSSVDKLFRETRTGPYAYLNTWSLKRFIAEYWHWLMLAGVLVAGLTLHSVRVTQLVHKRTAALRQSLAELQVLKEEAQGAAQRIERLERAGVVAQLSVIFAHEMRQPLGAISLYSFGLRRMLGNGSTDTARMTDVIDRLDRQTERANEIVARVRSYAKAEQPTRVLVSLREQVDRAAADLKTTGRYSTALRVIVTDEPVVTADPLEMELVALNLMKNALEASDAAGGAGEVVVTLFEEDERAIITVADDGGGTRETVERLNRGLGSTKAEGLGLGLSIVRGILEAYGGRLAFSARRQGGLVARVTVPVREVSGEPSPLDDDDSLRDALRFVLETEGWRVADYRSANDFFRGDAPSVPGCVVMDVRMPGLTGIEAQAVMNERGFSLPVIFLTGHGDIDMAVMALHEGAADFIQKPVDNERLLAVIASTAFESLSGAGAVLDGETAKARCAELTNRERDIARLVAEGLTNRLIGERLSIAVRTVEVHRASALRKLGVRTPEEVRAVLEAGA